MVSQWKAINENYKHLDGYKRVAWPPVSEERIIREFTPQPQPQNYPQAQHQSGQQQPDHHQEPAQQYQQQHHQQHPQPQAQQQRQQSPYYQQPQTQQHQQQHPNYSQDQVDYQQQQQQQQQHQQLPYPEDYRGGSPGIIQLRKETPVSQQPAPVYNSQPAALSYGGGSNMRGDLKWPPPEYKEAAARENEERRKIALGPVCRPRRINRDYTPFFAKNALSHHYPSYKVPPGTQHMSF